MAAGGGPRTVVLVDDEEPFLLSLTDAFAVHSPRLRVLTAHDGRQALELIRRHGVDLVVTDLKMSGMSGMALLDALARDHAGVMVMVMTAYNSPAIESALAKYSPVACFEKPIDLDRFVEAVLGALGTPSRARGGGGLPASMVALVCLLGHALPAVAPLRTAAAAALESAAGQPTVMSQATGELWRTFPCNDPRA